ncbi:MAG TPA: acylphosphatase [Casimicrobiaceae bacterium]|nr:acylphosphatase [Casimicrobiaceae bacterium]
MTGMASPDPRALQAGGDALRETRIDGEQVYRGALLDVRRDRARLPDGHEAVREYIVHPGAVLVVPIDDGGRMIVERQFRYPHDRSFIEFPAGKLDPGERPLATGVRELAEEVGYEAQVWTRLGVVHPVISYSTEAIEIYAAQGLSYVGAKLDPGEFLEVHPMSTDELYAALDEGRLTDAKSIAALTLHERWMGAAKRSVNVRVRGRVQGVGYRDFAYHEAAALGVTGFVRNRRDGSVEAHVQGSRERCDAFVERCRRGPRASSVARIEIARAAEDAGLTEFTVRSSG